MGTASTGCARSPAATPGRVAFGELALVGADSAVAHVDRPFGLVLLDENTATHLALGFGFPDLADEQTQARVNQSGDHLDLTIGSPELQITALDRIGGSEQTLMRDGQWALSGVNETRP